ncbi:MAG: hypothetical protein ABI430_02985 [Candidatus Taylorbacteria bacterium]
MISVKCVGGPYNGVVWAVPREMNPSTLFHDLIEKESGWEIDLSQASREEAIAWGGADLIARAVRAVRKGLTANFMGTEYSTMEELQSFEDAMVNSGYCVRVAQDDERGMVVDIVQPE